MATTKKGRVKRIHPEKVIIMMIGYEPENRTNEILPKTESYTVSGSDHGISYAPAAEQKKIDKKSVKFIAVLSAACIVLSGAFGFGGAVLANRVYTPMTADAAAESTQTVKSSSALSITKVSASAVTADVVTSTCGENLTYAEATAIVKDSVVEINTEYTVRNSWYQYSSGGSGSGVIISENGYIITNAHVILNEEMTKAADTVTVRLTDGSEYAAQVIAYDTDEDIAVLKIKAEGLTAAHIGDSSSLIVGEEILVVGNPLGELGGSVSNGIVSATEREIQVSSVTMKLIQTNAAVNPGNSGGGMFNLKGELVGIVNAKSSGTGIEGIGFAIPVNQAVSVAEQLVENGYVSGKPMIGVSLEDVSSSGSYGMFFSSGSGETQVIVRSLTKGMNDDVLKVGDVIFAVNGDEVGSYVDVKAAVSAAAVGDKMTFTIKRESKVMEVEVTIYERTPEAMSALDETETTDSALDDSKSDSDFRRRRNDQSDEIPDELPEQSADGFPGMNNGSEQEWQIPDSLADLFGGR